MEAAGARPASAKNLVQENVPRPRAGHRGRGGLAGQAKTGRREEEPGPPGQPDPPPPLADEDNEDANSYENVLICARTEPDSGDEGSEDYQNSASIRQWRESRRAVERAPREEPPTPAGSPDEDDDDDPDYVNQSVAAPEA